MITNYPNTTQISNKSIFSPIYAFVFRSRAITVYSHITWIQEKVNGLSLKHEEDVLVEFIRSLATNRE